MKVINLGEADSVLNNIIAQMRDKTVQKDSLRFRYNLERLGHIFAYELSNVSLTLICIINPQFLL